MAGGTKRRKTQKTDSTPNIQNDNLAGFIGISSKFAVLNKLITRDLNNDRTKPTFALYTKDDITTYLSDPSR